MDEAQLLQLVASKRASLGIARDVDPPPPPPSSLASSRGVRVALPPAMNEEALEPPSDAFRVPVSPDLGVVDLVHRRHDGYVSFTRRDRDGAAWSELGCMQASKMPTLFGDEAFDTAVDVDSFFSLHGMFASGRFKRRTTLDSLLPSLRQAKHVRWLTCCHVDLDSYNVGVDPEDGVAAILRAAREGIIPSPSLFSLSRGLWVLWLIRDDDNPGPVNAWPEARRLWMAAQGELHNRTAKLGSDRAALHPATVTRIPGSYSSKARKRVSYMPCLDAAGNVIAYTLPELFNALGVTPPNVVDVVPTINVTKASSTPKDPSRVERGKVGYTGRWNRFLMVLDQLRTMRGGWKVGHRSKAVFFIALAVKAKGMTGRPARVAMERALEGMQQPPGDQLTLDAALKVLKASRKPKKGGSNWQTVADDLDISPEEAAIISTRSSPIPPARRFDQLPAAATIPPQEITGRRRDAVKGIVERLGFVPPTSQLRELLLAEGHAPAAPATLLNDLVSIGHPSPRKKKPRAPKLECQPNLPNYVDMVLGVEPKEPSTDGEPAVKSPGSGDAFPGW